jgi:hypothetical protein
MMNLTFNIYHLNQFRRWIEKNAVFLLTVLLSAASVYFYIYYYFNGLGLAYNDARSHLDIGRRVVEGLKPGLAQLGSVWLPLTHVLMLPTIWNDFMWHSGLSGALQSMVAFVITGILIYKFMERINVGIIGRLVGVLIFALNLNVLYLQSTAMTELLLLATMTAGCLQLLHWFQDGRLLDLIIASFWIMLSTLIRYDGWFLLIFSALLIFIYAIRSRGYKFSEGLLILFITLGGLGVALWFIWNGLIFKDPLYFAFGPFSAHSQQQLLESAGELATKGNWLLSFKTYYYALMYNTGAFITLLGLAGALVLWTDKGRSSSTRLATVALVAPFLFNILALYLGHSVLFVQGISGNTWFNVRYGVMLMPSIAIFVGYLVDKLKPVRLVLVGLLVFITFFSFANWDAVTIDDARVGSSQKNVTQVSAYLKNHAIDTPGYILISAASHDAIIFSSGLPMKRFIHEGTGVYWHSAIASPDHWARWIILRTNDNSDLTWRSIHDKPGFSNYQLVNHFPFADVYEIKPEYLSQLPTDFSIVKQK